jgi:hypothetical protein
MMKFDKKLPLLIFRCVALGLGLGTVTLLGMEKMDANEAVYLLGLAVTCLAACSLGDSSQKDKE